MSASATALAKTERSIAMVRLADPAAAVGYVSLTIALLLVLFPGSFPAFVVDSWHGGQLTYGTMACTVLVDVALYLRVTHLRSARPGIVAAICVGFVPVLVVAGLNLLVQTSIAHTLSGDTSNFQARLDEEILINSYLIFVSAIFFPFFLIRFVQQVTPGDIPVVKLLRCRPR